MELQGFLLTSIYILLIIVLVVLIILGIKLIMVIDKTDKLINDVQNKVSSFDPIFNFIDSAASSVTNSLVGIVELFIGFVNKILKKRKDEDENE